MKSLQTYINEEEEEFHAKEIEALLKSVGGGNKAAGVYESWVHIVSQISGATTKPTVAQVQATRKSKEFHGEGEVWLKKIGFPGGKFEDRKVLLAIHHIGGDVKKIEAPISWGNVDIIHDSISTDYYGKLPNIWKTEQAKQNTADIIVITKGSAKTLSKALPKCTEQGSISWNEKGRCTIPDTGIEWYQVSLKKGIDDARIGKLGDYMKAKYTGAGYTPDISLMPVQIDNEIIKRGNYLGVSYGFDDRIDQILLDEGLFDVFKSIKDKVAGSFSKLVGWAKKKLRKLVGGVIKLARKVMDSNPVLDNANDMLKIAGVRNLGEEFLGEKEIRNLELKDSEQALLLKKFKIFEKQLSSNSVNKEFEKIKGNVQKLNARKSQKFAGGKQAVLLQSSDTEGKVDEARFAFMAKTIIQKLENNEGITSKDLFLPLKVASHYTAYNAINVILTDIYSNIGEHEGVLTAAMGFIADAKTEAKFGNTLLPLYIVYGGDGGAHYLGTKDTFKAKSKEEMINNPAAKNFDQPFVVVRIEKVGATEATYGLEGHNVTELHLMSGIDEKQELPIYLLLNFTTSSGSKFTMKPEVEGEKPKKWI